jgi:hypothetical protein
VPPLGYRCFPPKMMCRPIYNANQAPNTGEAHVLGMLRHSVSSTFDQQQKFAEDLMLLDVDLVIQHKSRPIELPPTVTPLHLTDSTQTSGQQEAQTPLMERSEAK